MVAGRRRLPRLLGTMRGCEAESKNMRRRVAPSSSARGGTPSSSMMHASWSTSFSPGNSGYLAAAAGARGAGVHC